MWVTVSDGALFCRNAMTGTRVMTSTRTQTAWTSSVGGVGRVATCSAATTAITPSVRDASSVTSAAQNCPLSMTPVSGHQINHLHQTMIDARN